MTSSVILVCYNVYKMKRKVRKKLNYKQFVKRRMAGGIDDVLEEAKAQEAVGV